MSGREGTLEVFDEQHEVEWVAWGGFELGAVLVEGSCGLVFAMDQQGTQPDLIGCCGDSPERISEQRPAQAVALLREIGTEAGQDDDGYRVSTSAFLDSLWGLVGCDRACGEGVVPDDAVVGEATDYVDPAGSALVGLEGVLAEPGRLRG
jgi:hypothetical protein